MPAPASPKTFWTRAPFGPNVRGYFDAGITSAAPVRARYGPKSAIVQSVGVLRRHRQSAGGTVGSHEKGVNAETRELSGAFEAMR